MKFGTFTYVCSKTSQTVSLDVDTLPEASQLYAMQKGLREYFDNYHASETLKAHGNDKAKQAAAVRPLVIEAETRIKAGDVPGHRVQINPAQMLAAQYGVPVEVIEASLKKAQAEVARAKPKEKVA